MQHNTDGVFRNAGKSGLIYWCAPKKLWCHLWFSWVKTTQLSAAENYERLWYRLSDCSVALWWLSCVSAARLCLKAHQGRCKYTSTLTTANGSSKPRWALYATCPLLSRAQNSQFTFLVENPYNRLIYDIETGLLSVVSSLCKRPQGIRQIMRELNNELVFFNL